jgi:hypothetical protein
MRVNVYGEEFTTEVVLVEQEIKNSHQHAFGVRFYLASPIELQPPQHRDDDRSAVTFWQIAPAPGQPIEHEPRLLLTLRAAVRLIEERQRQQK